MLSNFKTYLPVSSQFGAFPCRFVEESDAYKQSKVLILGIPLRGYIMLAWHQNRPFFDWGNKRRSSPGMHHNVPAIGFFKKLGFKPKRKEELPSKIWDECSRCPKYFQCDEVGLILECSQRVEVEM